MRCSSKNYVQYAEELATALASNAEYVCAASNASMYTTKQDVLTFEKYVGARSYICVEFSENIIMEKKKIKNRS